MEYSEILTVNQDYPVILKNEGDKQCSIVNLKGNAIFSVKKEKYDEIKECDWKKIDAMPLLEVNYGKKIGIYYKKFSEVIIPVKYNMINILTENLFSVYEKNKAGLYKVKLKLYAARRRFMKKYTLPSKGRVSGSHLIFIPKGDNLHYGFLAEHNLFCMEVPQNPHTQNTLLPAG